MEKDQKLVVGVGFAVILLAIALGLIGYQIQRTTPGSAVWARAKARAEQRIASWSETPKAMGRVMLERFGPPDGMGREALIWNERPPWKRVVVHRFPTESPLEQVVGYDVPSNKVELLQALGRGVQVGPLGSEISARSSGEDLNCLALNLADEIVHGRRTPEEAREFYERIAALRSAGKSSPYLQGLHFQPRRRLFPVPVDDGAL